MRNYELKCEPYKTKALELLKTTVLEVKGKHLIGFTYKSIYNIAKSTGLRSNKNRKIVKRFRYAMLDLLKRGINER